MCHVESLSCRCTHEACFFVLAAAVQVFSTDQQLAFELQGSSFKLVVGTLQVCSSSALVAGDVPVL